MSRGKKLVWTYLPLRAPLPATILVWQLYEHGYVDDFGLGILGVLVCIGWIFWAFRVVSNDYVGPDEL